MVRCAECTAPRARGLVPSRRTGRSLLPSIRDRPLQQQMWRLLWRELIDCNKERHSTSARPGSCTFLTLAFTKALLCSALKLECAWQLRPRY